MSRFLFYIASGHEQGEACLAPTSELPIFGFIGIEILLREALSFGVIFLYKAKHIQAVSLQV